MEFPSTPPPIGEDPPPDTGDGVVIAASSASAKNRPPLPGMEETDNAVAASSSASSAAMGAMDATTSAAAATAATLPPPQEEEKPLMLAQVTVEQAAATAPDAPPPPASAAAALPPPPQEEEPLSLAQVTAEQAANTADSDPPSPPPPPPPAAAAAAVVNLPISKEKLLSLAQVTAEQAAASADSDPPSPPPAAAAAVVAAFSLPKEEPSSLAQVTAEQTAEQTAESAAYSDPPSAAAVAAALPPPQEEPLSEQLTADQAVEVAAHSDSSTATDSRKPAAVEADASSDPPSAADSRSHRSAEAKAGSTVSDQAEAPDQAAEAAAFLDPRPAAAMRANAAKTTRGSSRRSAAAAAAPPHLEVPSLPSSKIGKKSGGVAYHVTAAEVAAEQAVEAEASSDAPPAAAAMRANATTTTTRTRGKSRHSRRSAAAAAAAAAASDHPPPPVAAIPANAKPTTTRRGGPISVRSVAAQAKRSRCGECPGCQTTVDCGTCVHCVRKQKQQSATGKGGSHMRCVQKLCHVLYPIATKTGNRRRDRKGRKKKKNIPTKAANSNTRKKRGRPRSTRANRDDESDDDDASASSSSASAEAPATGSCGRCPNCLRQKDCGSCPTCLLRGNNVHLVCDMRRCLRLSATTTTKRRSKGSSKHRSPKPPPAPSTANNNKRARTTTREPVVASTIAATTTTTASINKNQKVVFAPPLTLTSYVEEVISEEGRQAGAERLYGLDIPLDGTAGGDNRIVCSGCHGSRDDELDGQPVLLCDGPNCRREYHLACCVPALADTPPENKHWLCRDCCPEGSTAFLVQYLEDSDLHKAAFLRENPDAGVKDYVRLLVQDDSIDSGFPTHRYPESELDRGAMTHSLALCDPKSLARTRRGNEVLREPLPPDAHLGKPIRLYNPIGNEYHTGRIVDYRPAATESKKDSDDPDGSVLMAADTEFYVRFAAGCDDRKTPYHHWIMLEEHALAVGSTLVMAQIPAGNWVPGMVWLRTSRELVPNQEELHEQEGQIVFKEIDEEDQTTEKRNRKKPSSPSKTRHKVYALARSFGVEQWGLVNVRDMTMNLLAEGASGLQHKKQHKNVLSYQLALAEHAEQERVRNWRGMRQVHAFGPKALSSRDSYSLPPLMAQDRPALKTHASLCPSIPQGLDRSKIMKMLQARGVELTKDTAASLSCQSIPLDSRSIQAEEESWNLGHVGDSSLF